MRLFPKLLPLAFCLLPFASAGAAEAKSAASHGAAMHGDLKYGPDFQHFDYASPKAPKGGELRQATIGTFDSFNPFIVKGTPAAGLGRIYDALMDPSADEPFSEYGLVAETIEFPEDRSWVEFQLRKEARFHDGKAITPEDVIWTFHTLREKGNPFYRGYYANVVEVEKTGERGVRFTFQAGENRELPLILGQLSVLPKHYWEEREFDASTLDPPLGSGPYRIGRFDTGRSIAYERVPDYWGAKLPVNAGRHNFDRVRIDYYRDDTVSIEAFKGGEYDVRFENSSKDWATAYDFPAAKAGKVVKEELPHSRPAGMQAFAFNTRRPMFRDARVRRALGYAFDFEWSNRTLFYGQYARTRSYFDNSPLAATGLPNPAERALLEPFRDRLPEEVFTEEYNPPKTDGSGDIRGNLRKAFELLGAAGWAVDEKTRVLTHGESGRRMEFELLLVQPLFERVVLPFVKNLERLGVKAKVRTVDAAQYRRRVDDFDFDVIVHNWGQSLSPGNEQRNFWGSEFAGHKGSENVVGIDDPVVDAMIEAVIAAPDRESLVARVRALDRVLQWGHWVIPHWHIPYDRVVFWNKFGRPEVVPMMGVQIDTWWVDPVKQPK